MKLYTVTFNDGGWHTSLPKYDIVANSKEEAIQKVREDNKYYKDWEAWATEFKIPGYVIEIYDETSYNRDKKINEINEQE